MKKKIRWRIRARLMNPVVSGMCMCKCMGVSLCMFYPATGVPESRLT